MAVWTGDNYFGCIDGSVRVPADPSHWVSGIAVRWSDNYSGCIDGTNENSGYSVANNKGDYGYTPPHVAAR